MITCDENDERSVFKLFSFNTDFSLTITNTHIQLKEVLYNVRLEGSMSQIYQSGID